MGPAHPIRVLIVDDSPLVRHTLERIIAGDPAFKVVATASDGVEALARIRAVKPDVVTLDVMMPRLDGLKVLAHVMRDNPVRVVMLSSLTQEGADETLQSLDLGAVDFVDKTALLLSGDPDAAGRDLLSKIRTAAAVDPARLGLRQAVSTEPAAHAPARGAGGSGIVVIGASTGGPPALHGLVPALPSDFPAGIVIVQHIPAGFTRPLANRLDAASALAVREAESGDRVRPGEVLVAPGGRHLTFVERGGESVVALGLEPADSLHRPSVDVTMQSAAERWGRRSAGVLLTGMGSDGAAGMWAIHARGGWTVAESEESCVVYGMPRAAVELGAVSEVVPLGKIAERLIEAVER